MTLKTLFTAGAASLALFASAPALADGHSSAAAKSSEVSGPAMWKIADADTTIYLFGTVHALPEGIDWYKDDIAKALTTSDTLVTEIRMDKQSEARMQAVAMQKAMLPEGTTLRSLLSEEQTATYEAALGELGLPAPAFDRLEPWMVGLTMVMLPLMKEGYSPDSGVEKVLLGKVGDKPQDALETIEFQLGIFDGMPQDKQITFMMEAVEGMDEAKPTLDKMVDRWVNGDAEGLAEIMNEGMEDPEIAEALLYKRNANWVDWIENRLDEPGSVFIAVGAGHLAGEKSVQDMLAKRSYYVQRVR